MDCGAVVSVTNLTSLLHNVKVFKIYFKSNDCIHGATSKQITTPCAVWYMRVRVLTSQGFVDVKLYYWTHFSFTLPSHVSVIKAIGQPKHHISQGMTLFFAPNEVILDQGLVSNVVHLRNIDYNHDYGTCRLTCATVIKHSRSISVPGVIRPDLCFTQPLIIPSLDKNDPKATVLNSFEKAKSEDPEFVKRVTDRSLTLIYDYMQKENTELISCLKSNLFLRSTTSCNFMIIFQRLFWLQPLTKKLKQCYGTSVSSIVVHIPSRVRCYMSKVYLICWPSTLMMS